MCPEFTSLFLLLLNRYLRRPRTRSESLWWCWAMPACGGSTQQVRYPPLPSLPPSVPPSLLSSFPVPLSLFPRLSILSTLLLPVH